jgi:hypothetical protein
LREEGPFFLSFCPAFVKGWKVREIYRPALLPAWNQRMSCDLRHMSCVCALETWYAGNFAAGGVMEKRTLHASRIADSRWLPHRSAERGTYLLDYLLMSGCMPVARTRRAVARSARIIIKFHVCVVVVAFVFRWSWSMTRWKQHKSSGWKPLVAASFTRGIAVSGCP